MSAWTVVALAAVVALGTVVAALLAAGRRLRVRPAPPDWHVPTPGEIRGLAFPLAWQGYDPEHVDVILADLADAYEELYLAAGPSAISRARARRAERRDRAALRSGTPGSPPPPRRGPRRGPSGPPGAGPAPG